MTGFRGAVAALALVTLGLCGAGAAGPRPSNSRAEARDATGEVATRLDIVFVRFEGLGDGEAALTIRTKRGWACSYLENEPLGGYSDGSGAFLRWDLDRDGDDYFERAGNFHCRSGMVLEMSDSGAVFTARKPNSRTITVRLPIRELGLDIRSLRLKANSQVNGVSDGGVFFEEGDASPVLSP